jgi:FdhE protein
MSGGKWEKRRERASELAAVHPFAAEGLRFYERIAAFQQALYGSFQAGNGGRLARPARRAGALREQLELPLLLPRFGPFLELLAEVSPPPLAQSAGELRARGAAGWEEALVRFWRTGIADPMPAEGLLAWAFLQPYAEHLADGSEPLAVDGTPGICPSCCSRPLVGVLRPQGDGGKRSLVCGLCATEWEFRRIGCPSCGEEGVDKLPVYVDQAAAALGHVRIEACDSCSHYITTIDMTRNGRAVPVVDELASIPLSLWANEHGYTKLSPNLLGI